VGSSRLLDQGFRALLAVSATLSTDPLRMQGEQKHSIKRYGVVWIKGPRVCYGVVTSAGKTW
jgi:hypothetical protein